jgi:hypothetical protein
VHVFNNGEQDGTDTSEYSFPLLVANGVLGVRDMSSDPDDIVQAGRWNQEIDAGRLIAPRMMVTSSIVDGSPPTWSNSVVVRTAGEARAAVRSLKTARAGMIKVYWNLSREAYFAIADESKRQRIPFGGHVPYVVGAGEASDRGQSTVEHLEGVAQACSTKESEWLAKRQAGTWTPADALEMRRTFSGSKCAALAKRFERNGTWLVPTSVVFFDPRGIDLSSRLRYASPEGADRIRRNVPKPGDRANQIAQEAELAMRRVMRQAGSSLFLTGTDLSRARATNLPGFSLHDELALFVELGFTSKEAVRAATYNAAKFANRLHDYGTVEQGKRADLVLLNANPLEDIHNTSDIHAVMLNGRLLDYSALERLLARGATAATRQ